MEEGTLFEYLKKRANKLSEKETAVKIKEVTSAIKYLHDIDVAHRDIKPENIVLSNVSILLFREYLNCAILVGQPDVLTGEKLTAVLSIMLHLRFSKGRSTIGVWTCGVWEF